MEAQRETGVTKRLVQVAVADESVLLHHNEPIWRNGEMVGYVTGGMWGHTVGAAVGMGWVDRGETFTADWVKEGEWSVEVSGARPPARVQLRPFL